MKKLASLCIITYNQEKFILEALKGAVSQNYDHLEIIISDDASTDKTFYIIEDFQKNYSGKHKIIINKNEENLGLAKHVNKVLYEIATGDFLFLAAGDDISKFNRVEKCMDFLQHNQDVVALGTYLEEIDENSAIANSRSFTKVTEKKIYDLQYYLSTEYRHLYGCTRVLKKNLIKAFPPLNADCPTEDTTLLFRAFLYGKVAELPDALISYRIHGNNISSSENLKKINVSEIFRQYEDDLEYATKNNYVTKNEKREIQKVLEIRKHERLGLSYPKDLKKKQLSLISSIKKIFR